MKPRLDLSCTALNFPTENLILAMLAEAYLEP